MPAARGGSGRLDSASASWETYTVIAFMGMDEARAPLVFLGSTDTGVFQSYVQQVLVPQLHEGDVGLSSTTSSLT